MANMIETDEVGQLVFSPELLQELLGETKPHTRYVVEVQGGKIYVSLEKTLQETEATQSKPGSEQWERQWRATQEQVSKSWPTGVSAADVVSEMRR